MRLAIQRYLLFTRERLSIARRDINRIIEPERSGPRVCDAARATPARIHSRCSTRFRFIVEN